MSTKTTSSKLPAITGQELPDRSEIIDVITGRTLIDVETSQDAQSAIARQIVEASSLDDAFKPRSSVASRDLVGVAIEVLSWRLRPGEIDGVRGNYALAEVVNLDTGEAFTMNTSAPNIVAQLWRATLDDAFPIRVTVEHAATAKAGRSAPLTLVPFSPNGEPWHHLKSGGRKAA